jgi:O-antigen/teichoic acid export membrane protein
MVFLDAGVFTFSYPELIRLHQQGQRDAMQRQLRTMLLHTLLVAVGFSIVSWFVLPYLLSWIHNPVYTLPVALSVGALCHCRERGGHGASLWAVRAAWTVRSSAATLRR